MSDQGFREIQLGGKQLVFLFMASVVFAVAIFLLGISVGRGVRNASGPPPDTEVAVSVPPAPAEMPPATVTSPQDLSYHDKLQGQSAPAAEAATTPKAPDIPAPPAEAPPPAAEPVAAASTMRAQTAPATPAPKPAEKPAPKVAPPVAPVANGWFVQVNAFRSRENAERQVATLKGKGYAALVSESGGLYRVRIGPFGQRDEANTTSQRLRREEGMPSSVQR